MVSTYSLVIKFPTPQGAEILRGDQATARSCYITSLCKNVVSVTLNMEEMGLRGEKEGMSPVEELTQLILDPERPDRFISIDSLLKSSQRAGLSQFLRQN